MVIFMKQIKLLFLYLFLLPFSIFSQIENDSTQIGKVISKLSVLDSIKKTFVNYSETTRIDSMWMKELSNNELSTILSEDILKINPDEKVEYDLSTDLLKERLAKLDAKSPFNVEYNVGLENIIKALLKNRKKSFERLLGISQYYFPMFEEALSKYNVPIEVKYLAVVESALNPNARSRVGATGLWQFMYHTGLQYKLDINSYIDERSDPIKATEAACQYLSGMFKIFGDWDLVLASYNCGPGNVTKAIRRSNGQTNYWNIRSKLPRETAGYLPAFLATMYIMEYHSEHGINKINPPVNFFKTDTIVIKNQLSFKQVSKLIDIPESDLQFLNPSYKLNIIPFSDKNINYLRLPVDKVAVFTSNEEKIYYYANYELRRREMPNAPKTLLKEAKSQVVDDLNNISKTKIYKVKRGDNLNQIAIDHNVAIADLKKWNYLKSNTVSLGSLLKIKINNEAVVAKDDNNIQIDSKAIISNHQIKIDTVVEKNESFSNLYSKVCKEDIVEVSTSKEVASQLKIGANTATREFQLTYSVKEGDNLHDIAESLFVSEEDLIYWNNLPNNNIAVGKILKYYGNSVQNKNGRMVNNKNVLEQESVSKTDYIVKAGDNLTSIAKHNSISVADLKKWNNIYSNKIAVGKRVIIFNPEITDPNTYVVAKGDNIWKIAEKHNVTAMQLKRWNNLKSYDLKDGIELVIAKTELNVGDKSNTTFKKLSAIETIQKTHLVKKGDSLFSISQKYPGVTVADIQKWNGIENVSIKPGMKLKIILL